MADGVSVGHQAAPSRRYYCYVCRTEVSVSDDFNCLRCKGGFVEEIPARVLIERLTYVTRSRGPRMHVDMLSSVSSSTEANNHNSNGSTNNDNNTHPSSDGNDAASERPLEAGATTSAGASSVSDGGLATLFGNGRSDTFRSAMMNMLMDVFDVFGNVGGGAGIDSRAPHAMNTNNNSSSNNSHNGNTAASTNTTRNAALPDDMRTRLRDWMLSHFAAIRARDSTRGNMVYDLIDVAFGPLNGASNANGTARNQMFFLSDSSGLSRQEEAVQSIFRNAINHLINGSPPLSQEKIDQIPKIDITAEDIAKHDVCAICREHFQLKETVRKLPCTHFFHEPCILPWLKLHRTCPVCRSWLGMNMGGDCTNAAMNEQEVNGEGVGLSHSASVQSESSTTSDDISTDDNVSSM